MSLAAPSQAAQAGPHVESLRAGSTATVAGRLLYGGVRAPDWLRNTTLVGQTMARAAAEQLAADAAAARASSGGADDARRIQAMLEVRLSMTCRTFRPQCGCNQALTTPSRPPFNAHNAIWWHWRTQKCKCSGPSCT